MESSHSDGKTMSVDAKDKGEVIMDVMNVFLKMRGFEYRMKELLQQMQQSVAQEKQHKLAVKQYLNQFHGNDATLCKVFLKDDLYRDSLHEVKIKNALAVVEDSIDVKTECIERFSEP